MFALSLMSSDDVTIEGVIEVNGVDLITVYSHVSWYQSTNVAFIECTPGDRVQVVCGTYRACALRTIATGGHEFHASNTFSGVLLDEY